VLFRSLQCFARVAATLVSADYLALIANFFDPIQSPALVLAPHYTECSAIAAGIERFRFLDRRPSAIGTREKTLFQFEEFFFFEPSPVFLPLSSESVFFALYVFLQCSNDRPHLDALRFL